MPGVSELNGPVGYGAIWTVLALALVAVVVTYYVAVALWARGEDPEPEQWRGSGVEGIRKKHLDELRRIESAVAAGRMPLRVAFHQLSRTVRSFAAESSDVPATSMALADLRADGPARLADAVEAMYPPSFAPGEATAEDFRRSLREARELVTSWT
jgi:hypothetical protein